VTLHFFVPVFFDVEPFLQLRERILRVLPVGSELHFHVLDDSAGSDPAVAKIEGATVHRMPRNLGHQRALVHGLREFLAGGGEGVIVTLDADGEDRPEDLPAILAAWESGLPGTVALARRTARSETTLFKVCYFFYKLLFRALAGTVIRTGNFAVLGSRTARELLCEPSFNHAYASSLVAHARELVLVPCPRGLRYSGYSKMSFAKLALHGVRMLVPFQRRIALRLAAMAVLL
jgi:polyisoprenyl-phosphate glycosyltransferase